MTHGKSIRKGTFLSAALALALALGGASAAIGSMPTQALADEATGSTATDVAATAPAPVTVKVAYKNMAGAKNPNAATVEKGKKIKLRKPTKQGYIFKGWFTDKKCKKALKSSTLTAKQTKKNVTVYAKWQAKTYKIAYKNMSKATNKNAKKFTYGKTIKLKKPVKKGYTFMGWYSDKYLTKKVTKVGGKTAKNVTVYAKWVQKPRNAAEKKGIKEAKKEVAELNNQGAQLLSKTLNDSYGIWIDPAGKKIGCSESLLRKASTYPKKTTDFIVKNCGINWYQQALMTANYCAGIVDYGLSNAEVKEMTKEVLREFGFTKSQISYALKYMKI